MNDNVVNWRSRRAITVPMQTSVGIVGECREGEALDVIPGGEESVLRVTGHLSAVPVLQQGDSVLYATTGEGGCVIIGRLRGVGEAPAAQITEQNGAVELKPRRSLRLQVGKSWLELTADGAIRIDGNEISAFAQGRFSLQGATLELN